MSLILCPECTKEVSDKAKQCIHCGYPLDEYVKKINKSNDIKIDQKCVLCGQNEWSYDKQTGCNICKCCGYIVVSDENRYNEYSKLIEIKKEQQVQNKQDLNVPKCPTCQSTNIRKIGAGERVASVLGLGIFSKKINKTWKCNNCGHTW